MTHPPPEVAAHRSGCDRAQQSFLHETYEALGLLLKERAALRVRQHDRLPVGADSLQQQVKMAGREAQGALDQEIGAGAKAQRVELLARQVS